MADAIDESGKGKEKVAEGKITEALIPVAKIAPSVEEVDELVEAIRSTMLQDLQPKALENRRKQLFKQWDNMALKAASQQSFVSIPVPNPLYGHVQDQRLEVWLREWILSHKFTGATHIVEAKRMKHNHGFLKHGQLGSKTYVVFLTPCLTAEEQKAVLQGDPWGF